MSRFMTTPPEEAAATLNQVVQELSSPDHDLKFVVRRCIHACIMSDWRSDAQRIGYELGGYPPGEAIPPFRTLKGKLRWQSKGVPIGRFNPIRNLDWKSIEDRGEDV